MNDLVGSVGEDVRQRFLDVKEVGARRNWTKGLPERKIAELRFHDDIRGRSSPAAAPTDAYEMLHGNKKFYATTGASQKYLAQWMREHVPGKIFLDYACGNGTETIKAAKCGARVALGLEISSVSVANAEKAAIAAGVGDHCVFIQGDCEETGLPASSVDVILCSGMLHHLDVSYAFPELRRILKPGGVIMAVEALDYNPVIKLYRQLTPAMRTAWEADQILSLNEVRFAARFFDLGEVRYWHLFSTLAAFVKNFPRLFSPLMFVLDSMDAIVLRIPCIRLLAWQFTFELHKRDGDV